MMISKRYFPLQAAFAALLLAGCSPEALTTTTQSESAVIAPAFGPQVVQPREPSSTIKVQSGAKLAAVRDQATGFKVGLPLSPRQIYVFFDPQCPHCNNLWESSKALHDKATFIWVPVGFMRGASTTQGAAILAAQDSQGLMNEHEGLMAAGRGGISARKGDLSAATLDAVETNTSLWKALGATSVPFMIGASATGETVELVGAYPPGMIIQQMGW